MFQVVETMGKEIHLSSSSSPLLLLSQHFKVHCPLPSSQAISSTLLPLAELPFPSTAEQL